MFLVSKFGFCRALSCLVLAIWPKSLGSASKIVIVDEALPTSKSCFGDVRIPKIDMYKETFACDCKGCSLRKVRMLFEMHKSQIFMVETVIKDVML